MQLKAKALRQLNSCQLQDPALSPTSPCLGRRWQATMMLVMMMTMMLMTMMLMLLMLLMLMPPISGRPPQCQCRSSAGWVGGLSNLKLEALSGQDTTGGTAG